MVSFCHRVPFKPRFQRSQRESAAQSQGAGVLALGYGWCVKAVRRCAGGRTEARAAAFLAARVLPCF
ncbi:hypothetical protein V6Z11_A04G156600 [Gossypium hirsutum]